MTAALTLPLILRRCTVTADNCLVYTGTDNGAGYKTVGSRYVHRIAHEAFIGPIPRGFEVDHLCRNRACCNPAHLEAVTPTENFRRAFAAKTQCKNGHPLPPFVPGQNRPCAPCHAARVAKARQRIKNGERPPVAIKQHGTVTSYIYGCRCAECREAQTNAQRARRVRARADLPPRLPKPPTCGTKHAYNKGCRCDLCRAANTEACRLSREKRAA